MLPAGMIVPALAEDHPALGTYPAGSSGSSVFVGISVPRTGTYAAPGEDLIKGYELAIEQCLTVPLGEYRGNESVVEAPQPLHLLAGRRLHRPNLSVGPAAAFVNWDGTAIQILPSDYIMADAYSYDGLRGVGSRYDARDSLTALFTFKTGDLTGATYHQITHYTPAAGIASSLRGTDAAQ